MSLTTPAAPHKGIGQTQEGDTPGPLVKLRLRLATAVLAVGFGLVLTRAYSLQIRDGNQYLALAEQQYLREIQLPAHRGRILDRTGGELAVSTEVDSAYANPRLVRAGAEDPPREIVAQLAKALKMDRSEVDKRLRSTQYFTWLKRRISPEEARALRELGLRGVGLLQEPRRYYPNRSLAGVVLGWAGTDATGLEGIELQFDRWLRGARAAIPSLQDGRGNKLLVSGVGDLSRDSGHDVELTLDKFIQFRLEKALEEGVAQARAKAGVAVAMDPRTGEILGMSSVPSVNPNDPSFASGHGGQSGRTGDKGARNRVVTDPFEPGSTVKPFSIAAALAEGVIRVDQEWDCEHGKWKVGKATIHDAEPENILTTTQVLARSSNICTAKITRRLGKEKLSQALHNFGFASLTGIELPGERAGILRSPEKWGEVAFATISFGQGMTATPLQLVTAMSALANGGTLYKPRIVREIRDPKGKVVFSSKPEGKQVVSHTVAKTMREMMRAVMLKKGTGEKLDIPGYPVAGKTGTAQKVDPGTRRYSPDHWASSFMGFAPYQDPRLAIFVMVDEPQGSHYGSAVAGPIFVKVMSAALPYLGVPPQSDPAAAGSTNQPSNQEPPAPPPSAKQDPKDVPVLDQPPEESGGTDDGVARMPDFRNLSLGEALRVAEEAGIRLEITGSGHTVSQVPPPGVPLKGLVCKLRLAPPH